MKNKLTILKSSLNSPWVFFTVFSKEAVTATEANFVMSNHLGRAKRAYSDGEFIKINIAQIVAVLNPSSTNFLRLKHKQRFYTKQKRGVSLRSVLMLQAKRKRILKLSCI